MKHSGRFSASCFLSAFASLSFFLPVQRHIRCFLITGVFFPSFVQAQPPAMVLVSGGTFSMGCTPEQATCITDESPVRDITVSDFYIGKYEITQKQWQAETGQNPSYFWQCGEECPVENFNWYDALAFCNLLSRKYGYRPCYYTNPGYSTQFANNDWPLTTAPTNQTIYWDRSANGFRLPSEAEWEYAARGGNVLSVQTTYSGSNTINNVAWYSGNSVVSYSPNLNGYGPSPTGLKTPNALGLYDMSGNVWEYCYDFYISPYPSASNQECNPAGPATGTRRVARGGSFYANASFVRIAERADTPTGTDPALSSQFIGIRLARNP